MQASALLLRFLADWLKWAESYDQYGDDHTMQGWTGLCRNYETWLIHNGMDYRDVAQEKHQLYLLLGRQHTPFNGDDLPKLHQRYAYEQSYRIFHKNPKRLAWVKQQLGIQP